MSDQDAAEFIYQEICDVIQQGLTEGDKFDDDFLRSLKEFYEARKYLTPRQIEIAQEKLGNYEARRKQQRLL